MPRMDTAMGEAIVYDGDNAAELATAVGAETVPEPDADSVIVLDVPLPTGGMAATPFPPGSGLIVREFGGFLPISEEQLAGFALPKGGKA